MPKLHEIPIEKLTFEEAYKLYEEIIAQLEKGEHSLDEAVLLFERGQEIARRCTTLLDQAELRIQTLQGEQVVDFNQEN